MRLMGMNSDRVGVVEKAFVKGVTPQPPLSGLLKKLHRSELTTAVIPAKAGMTNQNRFPPLQSANQPLPP